MRVILILLLTFSIKVSFCQETFHHVYDYKGDHDFGNVTIENDSGFFMFGLADWGNEWFSWIVQIRKIGNVINQSVFNLGNAPSTVEEFSNSIKFKDENFFVCGNANDILTPLDPFGFIGIFNPNFPDSFNIIFSDVDTNDRIEFLHYNGLNKINFAGWVFRNENTVKRLYTAAIDTTGQLLHLNYLPYTGHTLHSFNPTTDGGFVLGGNFQNGNQYDLFILKVDSLGNELWKKTYGGPFNDSKGYVNQTADGGLLICGYKMLNTDKNSAGYAIKTDNLGNIEWEKEFVFSPNYPDILIKYIEVNDGYVFCGGHDDENDRTLILLMKTDFHGTLVWERKYSYYPSHPDTIMANFTNDMILTSDSGFALTGYVWAPPPIQGIRGNDAFVLKVDKYGCLTPGCQLTGVEQLRVDLVNPNLLQVFPNPFAEVLNLQLNENTNGQIKIYNLQGQEVYRKMVVNKNSQPLNLSFLPKGIYTITFWQLEENGGHFLDSEIIIKK